MTAIRSIKQSLTGALGRVIPAKTRIACYLRVSTSSQTVDNQRPDVESYLQQYPDAKVSWYMDVDSAYQGNQHFLAELKNDIRSGKHKFDILIVWAFDRLTRRGGMDLLSEYKFFMDHGIRVVSLKERWLDVPKEFVPVLITLAGYLAEMESKRKSERIRAGNDRTLKQGVTKNGRKITQLGRPKGAKDRQKRRRAGYLRRYARDANNLSGSPTLESSSVE